MTDFDAIDALLAEARQEVPLPPVEERRALREELNVSRAQLAKVLNVSASTVGGWESGREPGGEVREKYAYFLDGARTKLAAAVGDTADDVTDPEERRLALDALVDHVVPGRALDSRPANKKELAATAVIRLDLDEVSAKLRTGGVNDEPEDLALPHWAGLLPLRKGYGTPVADSHLDPGTEVPDYLAAL